MDESKQPGITFDEVLIRDASVHIPDERPTGELNLEFDFETSNQVSSDGTHLVADFILSLHARDSNDGPTDFKVKFTLVGFFSSQAGEANLPLRKFALFQAPALMMPFAREFLYSLTARTRWRDILLPPLNVVAFIRAKELEKEVAATAAASESSEEF